MATIESHWYRSSLWLWLLSPLSLLFCMLVWIRQRLYHHKILKSVSFVAPLIVVGNITVGGSGKTPLVTYLVELLREHGYKPGIVSRGYGGQSDTWPRAVDETSDAVQVGDEAMLLWQRCHCPMVVGPDRVAAVEQLLGDNDVNVVISDDGMQHYRMGRDIEIAVIDGERRFGNGLCLPAGPLRETTVRLKKVDFIVANGEAQQGEYEMQLQPGEACSLADNRRQALADFASSQIHAVAAIGNPSRFFRTLEQANLAVIEHAFPDHHPYSAGELDFTGEHPVIMTEKDAVKYIPYASSRHWYLPVTAELNEEFSQRLLESVEKLRG